MGVPALTLQFMPNREDLYDVDEYADPERQHGHGRFHRRAAKLGVELVPLLWNSAIPSGTIEQPYKHKHNC